MDTKAPSMKSSAAPLEATATGAPAVAPVAALAKKTKRKRKSLAEWSKDIRKLHWSGITDDQVWQMSAGSWSGVPRAIGVICEVVIKEAHKKMQDNKSSAAGTTYMTIWLHAQESGIARIESEEDAAFESGYGGERGITTFRRHMKTLKEMGFIDYIEESRGRVKWVLIYNPYQVVKKLHEQGHLSTQTYRAVTERAMNIGAGHEMEDQEVSADGS